MESLVGSNDVNWRYVDCIISKDATEILPYEYRRCFLRTIWPDVLAGLARVFKMDESERAMLRGFLPPPPQMAD